MHLCALAKGGSHMEPTGRLILDFDVINHICFRRSQKNGSPVGASDWAECLGTNIPDTLTGTPAGG